MKQRYDVILFDADRTLFDFDQSQRLALGEVYRANGIPETEENIQTYVRLNDQLWARFDKGEISLEKLEYIRFRDFAEVLGLTNLNANQLNQQYIEALGRNSILLPGRRHCARRWPLIVPSTSSPMASRKPRRDGWSGRLSGSTSKRCTSPASWASGSRSVPTLRWSMTTLA